MGYFHIIIEGQLADTTEILVFWSGYHLRHADTYNLLLSDGDQVINFFMIVVQMFLIFLLVRGNDKSRSVYLTVAVESWDVGGVGELTHLWTHESSVLLCLEEDVDGLMIEGLVIALDEEGVCLLILLSAFLHNSK
jgi:hypothetical protein